MSDLPQDVPPSSRLNAFWASLKRWGTLWTESSSKAAAATAVAFGIREGRWPGASRPVYLEVSPASADPFPEPRTIPYGWDMSELDKSR